MSLAAASAHSHSANELAELRSEFQTQRAAAVAAYRANLRPDPLLQNLRRIVDRVIARLLVTRPLPAGCTLAAVGGYGRGELFPHSDVDILVLLPRPAD